MITESKHEERVCVYCGKTYTTRIKTDRNKPKQPTCSRIAAAECTYCGGLYDVGLDRIDNKLGHSADNTLWACSLCNMTRGNRFTVEQMRQIGNVIRSFR